MNSVHRLFACAAALVAALFVGPAGAQPASPVPVIQGPTYVMTYVEVVPTATARAIAALKEYRDASRKESGAQSIDVYQEKGQSHRFVVSEVWKDRQTEDGHHKAAAMSDLVQKLKPIELGPLDIRIHQAHSVTPPRAPNANDVIIISHVDVFGGNVAKLIGLLNVLGEQSRKDNGVVRYEILDEVPAHPNHFRMLEEWTTPAAWEAHDLAQHTQAYREALMPMLGTPYDQRLYTLIN